MKEITSKELAIAVCMFLPLPGTVHPIQSCFLYSLPSKSGSIRLSSFSDDNPVSSAFLVPFPVFSCPLLSAELER